MRPATLSFEPRSQSLSRTKADVPARKTAAVESHASSQTTRQVVLAFESELASIAEETLRHPLTETGGELYGYFTHAGWPVVLFATIANADAHRTSTTFRPDAAQIQKEGLRLVDAFGLQHLGQWHSHHQLGLTTPSGTDRRTMNCAVQSARVNRLIQVITTIRSPAVHPRAFLYTSGQDDWQVIPWLTLPGASPIRTALGLECSPDDSIRMDESTTWAELRGENSASAGPAKPSRFLEAIKKEMIAFKKAAIPFEASLAANSVQMGIEWRGLALQVKMTEEYPITQPDIQGLPKNIALPTWNAGVRIADWLSDATAKPKPRKRRLVKSVNRPALRPAVTRAYLGVQFSETRIKLEA